jgi:hypothetical protein
MRRDAPGGAKDAGELGRPPRLRVTGAQDRLPGQSRNPSRTKRPRRQGDHRQERAERNELGEITQRLNSNRLHHGLLDHDKTMLCSFYVPVNGAGAD